MSSQPPVDGELAAHAPVTDAELVSRCLRSEPRAWDELVERFSRYVFAIAAQGFRLAPADAEDIFQDVFAKVYDNLDHLRDGSAVRPWIGQLTRRTCIDHLRSSAHEHAADEVEPAGAEDVFAALDEALEVRAALERLPETCREILDRFFARDESYRAIGEALDLPPGTIASRISRCLERLKAVMEETDAPERPVDG